MDAVPAALADRPLNDESRAYVAFHRRRWAFLLSVVEGLRCDAGAGPDGEGLRILDVGPHLQTLLLRMRYPSATVDTLGLPLPTLGTDGGLLEPRDGEHHFRLDLNRADEPEGGPPPGRYGILVMAEVIEHLHLAPVPVLSLAATWLAPGGRLIVQTPNATALHQRVKLAIGRSPYEPIRVTKDNPGHFHEYTRPELDAAARAAGLRPVWASTHNYLELGGAAGAVYRLLGDFMPAGLRQGITACYSRE